jgi:hypothetical protein
MNISVPFIARPVATTLLTISVALADIFAFLKLPVSPLPQVDFPIISVQAQLPGASSDGGDFVAEPLERHLGQIADVTERTSASSGALVRGSTTGCAPPSRLLISGFGLPVGDVEVGLRRECRVRAAVEWVPAEPGGGLVLAPHLRGGALVIISVAEVRPSPSRCSSRSGRCDWDGDILIAPFPRGGLSPEATVLMKTVAQGLPRDLPAGCFWVDP